jgi:hypothetical protein
MSLNTNASSVDQANNITTHFPFVDIGLLVNSHWIGIAPFIHRATFLRFRRSILWYNDEFDNEYFAFGEKLFLLDYAQLHACKPFIE